jgi:hypothetical protein
MVSGEITASVEEDIDDDVIVLVSVSTAVKEIDMNDIVKKKKRADDVTLTTITLGDLLFSLKKKERKKSYIYHRNGKTYRFYCLLSIHLPSSRIQKKNQEQTVGHTREQKTKTEKEQD